jgi:H+-translocating NAD(P) transhydrogenase subunit alpha
VKVSVPKETKPGERRVALVPDVAGKLVDAGFDVLVQARAGAEAHLADDLYAEKGAKIVPEAVEALRQADVVTKVSAPEAAELDAMREGAILIGFLSPLTNQELVKRLAERGITSFAVEMIPRTTRAQSMDALSSQAVVAGYRATLAAATLLGKFFPMLITAAGTAKPSRVLVLGAGVAGLQAIGTAKRLGAVVEAYDVRPAVKEEVESLGAKFVQIEMEAESEGGGSGQYAKELSEDQQRRQRELLAERVAAADCVVTTAAVPGRPAPKLITEEMVRAMRPGSVIVDIAIDQGGCVETSRMTTHSEPTYVVHDVVHYCVGNMPGAVPNTSTYALTNVTLPYVLDVAEEGLETAVRSDPALASGVNVYGGSVTNDGVAEAHGFDRVELDRLIDGLG